jgi:hypothetical protein
MSKQGTWLWACEQMQDGKTVIRFRDSGLVRFNYDQGRRKINAIIFWDSEGHEGTEWGISMEDVYATDFKIIQ